MAVRRQLWCSVAISLSSRLTLIIVIKPPPSYLISIGYFSTYLSFWYFNVTIYSSLAIFYMPREIWVNCKPNQNFTRLKLALALTRSDDHPPTPLPRVLDYHTSLIMHESNLPTSFPV